MRIWHEDLIPKLCRNHLLGLWREANGCYKIITEGKRGYANHPATKEFTNAPRALYEVLGQVRQEMLRRGYHPKELPPAPNSTSNIRVPWQTLEEQIAVLKSKGCKCKI